MKLKAFIILCFLLSFIGNLNAQKKFIGFSGGIVHPFTKENDGTLGWNSCFLALSTEYSPVKAPFSLGLGIQYFSAYQYLMLPLSINFLMGNRLKFKLMGGFVPLLRLRSEAPDKSFVIGWQLGTGFNYSLKTRYVVFADCMLNGFPKIDYARSHFGNKETERVQETFGCLSIGLKYLISPPAN